MPYIKPEMRKKYQPILDSIEAAFVDGITPGELNYLISKICLTYVTRKGLSYTFLNDIMGVLSSCSKEFYRRVVAPYENEKVIQNGDCF